MATTAGPAASAVTISTTSTSGAPAATYYIVVSYTATSNESLLSQEFIVNAAAGTTPTINVASAGAPAAATNFAAYVSTIEGGEALQQASKTTTALGSTFTVPYPLINLSGIVRGATNSSGSIAGIALHDSQSLWATGVGGSGTAGGITNLLGYQMPPPPLGQQLDAGMALVVSLLNGQPFEISLAQPWSSGLVGATAGLLLDTAQQAAGVFVADISQSNKVMTILRASGGAQSDVGGGIGDTGSRIVCSMIASTVV